MLVKMKKRLIHSILILLTLLPLQAAAEGWSAFAEYLEWKTSDKPTTLWENGASLGTDGTVNVITSNLSFPWSQGFRGGVGYAPASRFLDTSLYWTFFPATGHGTANAPYQILVPEFFSGFVSGDIFFSAGIDWRLYMNTIDLETSHEFRIAKGFFLRPFVGVKGGTINQSVNATYTEPLLTSTENVKHNFFGIGPNFGLKGKWNFYKELNLVGSFSTAFLWGNWTVTDTYVRSQPSILVTPETITTHFNNSELGTLMLDYFLGMEWAHKGKGKVSIAARLGYEAQFWSNQIRMLTFNQLPTRGDLTFQGGTCGIYIGF